MCADPCSQLHAHGGLFLIMSNMISLNKLSKAFSGKVILQDLDLEIEKGHSLVVIGGSGTGKSVLLKCIMNLIRPDSGKVLVDGQDVTNIAIHRRQGPKFGMLFQGGALFDSLRVWENISFSLTQGHGLTRSDAHGHAVKKLQDVGLSADVADLYPVELSGGMQKRVGLARAISNDPDIIFFDEPTTGLDPIMSDVINLLIRDCVDRLGATAVTITHDMASAQRIGDDIAMLQQGQIIWRGPAKLVRESGNEYVDQFVHGRAEGPITIPGGKN